VDSCFDFDEIGNKNFVSPHASFQFALDPDFIPFLYGSFISYRHARKTVTENDASCSIQRPCSPFEMNKTRQGRRALATHDIHIRITKS